ncbi:uncharacterized protein TRAVEDRAFT_54106 [Trametes versicolor FP-101664 SS1]|uniref:Uncharacterized protein n=1 Tax=Trametes versicolor (strain FP-101664) TaxID=717944 RepID=R7S909_TRAVS|nr:uncharacterized protein TRAVEDRAFT_54106 [Trametes versicolor FP-101664 SS1]EIW52132.1 hypothetical protein TRAVEDRAFT_54106 [Trametes versicolor FP-101664 SS1]
MLEAAAVAGARVDLAWHSSRDRDQCGCTRRAQARVSSLLPAAIFTADLLADMVDPPQLRISCRMVCTDQWLVTHVDPSWPVSQLKQILVQRFSRERKTVEKSRRTIPVSPHKTRRRSLSPITFAAPRKPRPIVTENTPSVVSEEGPEAAEETEELDSDEEDDEVVDVNKALSEAHRYKYNTRPSTSSTSDTVSRLPPPESSGTSQEVEGCVLITFSTTQILEDRFSLDWYDIHPGELLELHPLAHSFISLPRFSLDAYIAPYFAARVWALRVVGNALDSTLRDLGIPRDHQTDDEIPDVSPRSPLLRDRKKKITLEWKESYDSAATPNHEPGLPVRTIRAKLVGGIIPTSTGRVVATRITRGVRDFEQ